MKGQCGRFIGSGGWAGSSAGGESHGKVVCRIEGVLSNKVGEG